MDISLRPLKGVAEIFGLMERAQAIESPRTYNTQHALDLDGYALVPVRCKGRYRVVKIPPVPYRDGLHITALLMEMRPLLREMAATDGRKALEGVVHLVPQLERAVRRCVYPMTGRSWWWWKGRLAQLGRLVGLWNPLRGATLEEVASLANFLLQPRTTPRSG